MLTDYYKHIMNAMLMLMNDEYFLKFNGKNFLDMDVPVKKINTKSNPENDQKSDQTKKQKKYIPIDLDGVPVFDFFKNVWHTKGNVLNTYCLTTVKDVKSDFTKIMPNGYWTYEKCHEAALSCKTRGEFQIKYVGAYNAALKNKWLDDVCSHMLEKNKTKFIKIRLSEADYYYFKNSYNNISIIMYSIIKSAINENKLIIKQELNVIKTENKTKYFKVRLSEAEYNNFKEKCKYSNMSAYIIEQLKIIATQNTFKKSA